MITIAAEKPPLTKADPPFFTESAHRGLEPSTLEQGAWPGGGGVSHPREETV
jgi:hypothetical protein